MQIEAMTAIETVNRILKVNPGSRQDEPGSAAQRAPGAPANYKLAADSNPANVQPITVIQQELEKFDISLKFSRDSETGTTVVALVNDITGETLRQIPSDASLHLASVLGKLQGKIFNRKA